MRRTSAWPGPAARVLVASEWRSGGGLFVVAGRWAASRVHHDREVTVSAAECGFCLADLPDPDAEFCSDDCREKWTELFGPPPPEDMTADEDEYSGDTLPFVY